MEFVQTRVESLLPIPPPEYVPLVVALPATVELITYKLPFLQLLIPPPISFEVLFAIVEL